VEVSHPGQSQQCGPEHCPRTQFPALDPQLLHVAQDLVDVDGVDCSAPGHDVSIDEALAVKEAACVWSGSGLVWSLSWARLPLLNPCWDCS
jgi:hypothetical protein